MIETFRDHSREGERNRRA